MFLFTCQWDEKNGKTDQYDVNRQIVGLLVEGYFGNLGQKDRANGSTALHVACDLLNDIKIIQQIVNGGADINAVNNDSLTPLAIVKRRSLLEPENEVVREIEKYLVECGAAKPEGEVGQVKQFHSDFESERKT